MDFKHCFLQQIKMHPSMDYQDVIKLCYQSAFGAEHILSDTERARAYLYAEFESVSVTDEPLFERISPDVVRVNLGAWKREGLPVSALFEMFKSSAHIKYDAKELFLSYLDEAEQVMAVKMPDFDRKKWIDFLEEYKRSGMPPMHHSDTYRECENPHYRIVLSSCFER